MRFVPAFNGLTFSLLICASLSQSQRHTQHILKDKPSPFTQEFENLVEHNLESWNVPGISIAVVEGDEVWAEGYGISKYPSTRVTPDTLFYGASTTKAFVAAAISLLIDNSSSFANVQWDTPISQLLRDDFVLEDEYATTHITIEDALSHRSGMPRHDFSYGGYYGADHHEARPKDVVRALRYLPLTAQPRTKWQYCNMMYTTAQHVIETLTGQWLGDFLRQRIWDPLRMNSTYFSAEDAEAGPEPLAMGYVYYNNSYVAVPYMNEKLAASEGAGAIISNVYDYAIWIQSFITSSGPISKAGHEALRTSRSILPPEDNSPFVGPMTYALGWEKGFYRGHEFLTHSGGAEAFSTQLFIFPALNWGAVSFGNTAGTAAFAELSLIFYLLDEKLGVPEKERFDFNKKYKAALKEKADNVKNAVKIHYRNVPSPGLPHSLPLRNYTGTYWHPAYRNVTIILKDKVLHVERQNVAWKCQFDLEHVSGEYFMAYVDSTTAPGLLFRVAMPAEFIIGIDGVPKSLGLAAEPEMGSEGRIWFGRIL